MKKSQATLGDGSVLLVHPTGNDNVRQALLALNQADALAGFHTTLVWQPNAALATLLPAGMLSELDRRSYPEIPANLVYAHPWRELIRLVAQRKGWRSLVRHQTGRFRMDSVCESLDRAVAACIIRQDGRTRPAAVYAYEDCAVESFRAARTQGSKCIYELPIGYVRAWFALLKEEVAREPLWGQTIDMNAYSEARLARKDAELEAADAVVVPSEFVSRSLRGFPAGKVTIVPYGCPPVEDSALRKRPAAGPLRVLFVGYISQRKGISYLLRAIDQIKGAAELTLIGQFSHSSAELSAQLNRHRWIRTLPHEKVLEEMRSHDVLVLPTLCEGRALVVLEALSQGLPVITTLNSGTEDVVVEGLSGFMVPICSSEAIAAALTKLVEDRRVLEDLSQGALRIAREYGWARYRERLLRTIAEVMEAK
jgi:glycosyltransferase involved in cell wall biosynthesis